MRIKEIKAASNHWVWTSLTLTLLFAWILIYPMHGLILQKVFGSNAYALGHVFTACHGLGLVASGLLPHYITRNKVLIKLAGIAIFVLTFAWAIIPQNGVIEFIICSFLGFSSAYLVLAWASGFMDNKEPALTLGVSMALTNVLLGLVGFAHNISENAFVIAASFTGLAPLLGAFYIARTKALENNCDKPEEDKNFKGGIHTFLGVAFLAAAAYFSGGLWYRAVQPLFYSKWPDLMGLDFFIYAFAVLGLAFYARKHPFYWVGTIGLSTLGIGLAISVVGLDSPAVVALSLAFFAAGLGAIDLFYWLTLKKLSVYLGSQKSFGFGLGLSLFAITAPGIAMDTGVLTNPLLSPIPSVIGACLLFLINPLLVFLLHPLTVKFHPVDKPTTPTKDAENITDSRHPAFWHSLTNSEKKVFELICKGRTDTEISVDLFISRHTVKFHARNILRKAGVPNRKELLAQLVNNHDMKKNQ